MAIIADAMTPHVAARLPDKRAGRRSGPERLLRALFPAHGSGCFFHPPIGLSVFAN